MTSLFGWEEANYRQKGSKGRFRASFLEVPKLLGRISGDMILVVSPKRRRLEAPNFAVILVFIPFTTYQKTSFTEQAGRGFRNGCSGPKSFRDFRETSPREGNRN